MPLGKDIRVLGRRETALAVICRVLGCGLGGLVAALASPYAFMAGPFGPVAAAFGVGSGLALLLRRFGDPLLSTLLGTVLLWSCCCCTLALTISMQGSLFWAGLPAVQNILAVIAGMIFGPLGDCGVGAVRGRPLWYGVNLAVGVLASLGWLLLQRGQIGVAGLPLPLALAGLAALLCGLIPGLLLLCLGATADTPWSRLGFQKQQQPG